MKKTKVKNKNATVKNTVDAVCGPALRKIHAERKELCKYIRYDLESNRTVEELLSGIPAAIKERMHKETAGWVDRPLCSAMRRAVRAATIVSRIPLTGFTVQPLLFSACFLLHAPTCRKLPTEHLYPLQRALRYPLGVEFRLMDIYPNPKFYKDRVQSAVERCSDDDNWHWRNSLLIDYECYWETLRLFEEYAFGRCSSMYDPAVAEHCFEYAEVLDFAYMKADTIRAKLNRLIEALEVEIYKLTPKKIGSKKL
jgi:hypothetical protein